MFRTLYYNNYQKAQILYINSVLLSLEYNLVNINNISSVKENQEMLLLFCDKLQEGYHLFYNYFMEYKSGVGENVGELFDQKEINQISINWENHKILNDFINEMQLLIYRIYDTANIKNITKEIIDDCEFLLFGKFQNSNNITKTIETHGNFIIILYYIIFNYDKVWNIFFEEINSSIELSFKKFSDKIVKYYLILEVIGIIFFFLIFIINSIYLIKSNKYIFLNILCLFLDFTQKNKYNFNNKMDNILINKSIINYITLLNEFTPKKFEILQNDIFNYDLHEIYNKDLSNTFVSDLNNIDNKVNSINEEKRLKKKKRKSIKSDSGSNSPGRKKTKKIFSIIKLTKKNNLNNIDNLKDKQENIVPNNNIHKLNFSNLSHNFNGNLNDSKKDSNNSIKNNLSKDISNISSINENNNNNSSILNLKDFNNSSLSTTKVNENSKKEKNDKNSYLFDPESKLTIEKIIKHSKIVVIQSFKIIMIIFL